MNLATVSVTGQSGRGRGREIYAQISVLNLKLCNEEHLLSSFWVGGPFVGLPMSQCREEDEKEEEEEGSLINRRSLQQTHSVKASAAAPIQHSPTAPVTLCSESMHQCLLSVCVLNRCL